MNALTVFHRVSLQNTTNQRHNVHIAVHPFRCHEGIVMMMRRGDYGWRENLPSWKQSLANRLWDEIPGLQTLFFSNGNVTLQHSGAFSDAEIFEGACAILRPVLEEQLKLDAIQTAIATPEAGQ